MVENREYASFVLRTVRALVRRASDDADALPLLAEISRAADEALNSAIVKCHANGWSTGEIATRLGITRQAVHQRIQRQG